MTYFLHNKKVLVTGASGFIGSHLTIALLEKGAQVYTLSSNNITKSPLIDKKIAKSIKHEFVHDITDTAYIKALFKKNQFNICFHLAAQPLVDIAEMDPTPTFEVNIKGTWNILEAARQNNLDGVIIASTTHIYGKNKLPYMEKFFPRPSRPYETSKACADIIAQTYAQYYEMPVAIARCVNVYGPGDTNRRLVPATIKLLMSNKNPKIYADHTTRDYMYIADAINGYLLLAEKIKFLTKISPNVVFNFGTGSHYTSATVIKRIIALLINGESLQ